MVGYNVRGNACDYTTNALPSGWTRVYSNPQPADVVVFKNGANMGVGYNEYAHSTYGHIGLIIRQNPSGTITTVETNTRTGANASYKERNTSSVACYIRPDFPTAQSLDVNISVDGTAYNSGVDFVTYDVTIAGSKVADDVKDYYDNSIPAGSSYVVNDIKVSGCYRSNGSASYSGTLNSATAVVIPIVTAHKGYTGAVTKAATCTQAGVKTYTCTCGDSYTEAIPATGHDYQSRQVEPTCTEEGRTIYTCKNCSDQYEEGMESWSEWSPVYPEGVSESLIESRTEYRYADKETTTSENSSLSGWTQTGSSWKQISNGSISYVKSWPGGFYTGNPLYATYNKTPKTASETTTRKTTVSEGVEGYLYWHWCRGYQYGPTNRLISDCYDEGGSFYYFHAFYSTLPPSQLERLQDVYKFVIGDACTDTYWWWPPVSVYKQNYTEYSKQYTYERWGAWSDWSVTAVTASATRKVETRRVYRVNGATRGEHEWDNGRITSEATYDSSGIKLFTCKLCGETKTEVIPVLTKTDISSCTVTLEAESYVYDGTQKTPSVSVKKGSAVLTKDKDYTVSYRNNVNPGTATVTITGINGYKGSVNKTFIIGEGSIITSQPADYQGLEKDQVTFHVEASGDELSYQWYYSKNGGTKWYKTSSTGYNTDTLSVKLTAARNGYMYRCEVTDGKGQSVTSEAATMTILSSDITITKQPESYEGYLKELVAFHVEAEGENLSYQWYVSQDGGETWTKTSNEGNKTEDLKVRLYAYRDGYQYRCVVTSGVDYDCAVTSEAAVLTKIPSTAKILLQPVAACDTVGNYVSYMVMATGEDISLQWQFSKNQGETWGNCTSEGYDKEQYDVKVTDARDGYLYRCAVTDSSKSTIYSDGVGLFKCKPTMITLQPKDYYGALNTSTEFTVAATGEELTYQWQYSKNGGASWADSSGTGATTKSMIVKATSTRNGYQYRCKITNRVGVVVYSNAASLNVQ